MKRQLICAGILSTIFFAGCADDKKIKTDSDVSTEQQMTIPVVNTDSIQQTATAPTDQPVMQVQPVGGAPATGATGTGAGMNPAHGQPGHRCDIAVGAPLKPGK